MVAEFYPSRRDPVMGIWAHRQALAVRDAGAEVRVIVLHRIVPPRAALADGPRARPATTLTRDARRAPPSGARRPRTSPTPPTSPRRASAAIRTWGAWAAPSLALALRQLRRSLPVRADPRPQRRAGRRRRPPREPPHAADRLRARRRRALHGLAGTARRARRRARARGRAARARQQPRHRRAVPRTGGGPHAGRAPRRGAPPAGAPAATASHYGGAGACPPGAADARDGRPPGGAQAPRRRAARARGARPATPARCATRSSARARSATRSRSLAARLGVADRVDFHGQLEPAERARPRRAARPCS